MSKLPTRSMLAAAALTSVCVGAYSARADEECGEECTMACCEEATESTQTAAVDEKAEKKAIPDSMTFLGADGLPEDFAERIKTNLVPLVGQPAPQLSLSEFSNTKGFTNDDFQGKITIVDVWATWCGPCIAAIPHNNELQEKYADQGVVFLGVTTANGQENLGKAIDQHKIAYPVAKDPEMKTRDAWKASFYPTYYVVDRDGVVRGVALHPEKIEEAIEFMLKEQPAPEATASAR